MNKTHIRLWLAKQGVKVTTNQIAVTAVELGFGDNEQGYTEDEAKKIMDALRTNRPDTTGEPTAPGATGATDATAALTLTRQTIAASTDALQNQALSFATRIQEGDRQLARQVAGFLKDRPNQFAIMLSEEISALMGTAETPEFIDVEVAAAPPLVLPSVGDSVAVTALGMAR